MTDAPTSDDYPDPVFTPFAYGKPEHMAEAWLPGGTPLSPIGIFSLYLDDKILKKIVESTNQYASIKQKALPAYLVWYRRWQPVSLGELRHFLYTTILMGYD